METNQIAAAVQRGEADLLELWESVRHFSYDRAYRWSKATEGRAADRDLPPSRGGGGRPFLVVLSDDRRGDRGGQAGIARAGE